jgi:predicted nucleic acid-binding protein
VTLAVDSSVVVAALRTSEPHYAACTAVLDLGGLSIYLHALTETFSTLTGGRMSPRISPVQAAQLIEVGVLPFVAGVNLTAREYLTAMREAESRGVRGGAIHDYLHLVAARKAGAGKLYTLNVSDFLSFHRPGDPEIVHP